jgi:hypothetical protein
MVYNRITARGNIHIRDVPERAQCPPEKPAPSGKRIRRK